MDYEQKYLKLLSKEFPNVQSASSELINLNAILNLPKGTEYFIADIHGEYDAFNHLLKNASGIIKEKIKARFTEYDESKQNRLAFFIYYPTDMLEKYQQKLSSDDYEALLKQVLKDMVTLARLIVTKYTQSKVRKPYLKSLLTSCKNSFMSRVPMRIKNSITVRLLTRFLKPNAPTN